MLERASHRHLVVGAKSSLFNAARRLGLFRISRFLRRNSKSLLILCYHGISKSDEDLWKPSLYMTPAKFRQRLLTIKSLGLDVLPLEEALKRIEEGSLSRPAVALTFDDGWHDFYTQAFPLLKEFGFSATVYQTTYYSVYNRPVFDTACSYLLWRGRGKTISDPGHIGLGIDVHLNSKSAIDDLANRLRFHATERLLGGEEKDRALKVMAEQLGLDFGEFLQSRTLHLMNSDELRAVSHDGVHIELHTHRHKLPSDRISFLNEIAQNRELIRQTTGRRAQHFCYPNGAYRPEISDWLREAGIKSATTCDPGLVSKGTDFMLLPRVTDSNAVSQARFESWLAGVGVFGQPAPRGITGSCETTTDCELPAERADVSSVL